MSPHAGTREDVHFGSKRHWEPEVCSRENNGLLSELGRKHLLGSGVGKGYTVRDVTVPSLLRLCEEAVMKAPPRLSYAQSLRVIGDALETKGIVKFDLEKHGENYMLRVVTSEPALRVVTNQPATEGSFLKKIAQRLLRVGISAKEPADPAVVAQSRCFTPSDTFRLATQQQSRHGGLNAMPDAYKLAQVLRVVGDHLDRKEACAFTVSVSGHSLSVAYETGSGHQRDENFTIENLYDRAVQMYLRRSKRLEGVN